MLRSKKVKPENIGKLNNSGNWVKSEEQLKRLSAEHALEIAKAQEAQKLASGEYKYVTVPGTALVRPYRTLIKVSK